MTLFEGVTDVRPLSVRGGPDGWVIVDVGGRMGAWMGALWCPTPIRPVCCFATAVQVAQVVAEGYRRRYQRIALGEFPCLARNGASTR